MPASSDRPQNVRGAAPLWRRSFDVVERPVAAASEAWVQSETFMNSLALAWRVERRAIHVVERGWARCWRTVGVSTRTDLARLENQVAGVERQIRALRRESAAAPRADRKTSG